MTVTVAVDAMGGDQAPAAIVSGAVEAVRRAPIRALLVGAAATLESELARHRDSGRLSIAIVDAPDVVSMEEPPLAALRRKPCASVKVAADLVANAEAHALFSAGHTGATFLAAHAAFGVLPGVERPALAVIVPTRSGAAVLLDVGANLECRASHLVQFGLMGAAYARVELGLAAPAIGLLSIGEEAVKGNDLIRDAHAGLAAAPLAFIGNLGAQDLFSGRADVVVCDGFTGNIALKVGESAVEVVDAMLREEFSRGVMSRLGAALSRPRGAPVPAPRRLRGVRRRAAPRRGQGDDRRARPIVGARSAQRDPDGGAARRGARAGAAGRRARRWHDHAARDRLSFFPRAGCADPFPVLK